MKLSVRERPGYIWSKRRMPEGQVWWQWKEFPFQLSFVTVLPWVTARNERLRKGARAREKKRKREKERGLNGSSPGLLPHCWTFKQPGLRSTCRYERDSSSSMRGVLHVYKWTPCFWNTQHVCLCVWGGIFLYLSGEWIRKVWQVWYSGDIVLVPKTTILTNY